MVQNEENSASITGETLQRPQTNETGHRLHETEKIRNVKIKTHGQFSQSWISAKKPDKGNFVAHETTTDSMSPSFSLKDQVDIDHRENMPLVTFIAIVFIIVLRLLYTTICHT